MFPHGLVDPSFSLGVLTVCTKRGESDRGVQLASLYGSCPSAPSALLHAAATVGGAARLSCPTDAEVCRSERRPIRAQRSFGLELCTGDDGRFGCGAIVRGAAGQDDCCHLRVLI